MISTDAYRFLNIAKVTKLRGSRAVRLTYDSGATETVSRDYLIQTVERIGHPEAGALREHLTAAKLPKTGDAPAGS
jgi:hypothetical protein